jgi:hypothetical protein
MSGQFQRFMLVCLKTVRSRVPQFKYNFICRSQ